MTDPLSPSDVVRGFWTMMNTNEFQTVADTWLCPDFECRFPQSGEVIEGAQTFADFNAEYPTDGRWSFAVKACICEGDVVVSDVTVTDGQMNWTVVTFHTIRGTRIARHVEYWPDPFPPQPWRAHLTKPLKGAPHEP